MTVETVTSENLQEFNLSKLGIADKPDEKAPETPIADLADDAKEPQDEEKSEHKDEPAPKKGNGKLENRFAELTDKRRAAEERAERAEARARELEAKLEPKAEKEAVSDDIGPKPKPSEYQDAFEYAEHLAEWSSNKALKERDKQDAQRAQAAEREKVVKGWSERLSAAKTELPDWDDMVASSEAAVSDPVRDAIIENEHGPRILYALAADAELAKKISGMSVLKQLVEIGKLSAKFDKAEVKEEIKEPVKERPKAPAPITPVRGSRSPDNPVNEPGEFKGTFSEWKALRKKQA